MALEPPPLQLRFLPRTPVRQEVFEPDDLPWHHVDWTSLVTESGSLIALPVPWN